MTSWMDALDLFESKWMPEAVIFIGGVRAIGLPETVLICFPTQTRAYEWITDRTESLPPGASWGMHCTESNDPRMLVIQGYGLKPWIAQFNVEVHDGSESVQATQDQSDRRTEVPEMRTPVPGNNFIE